MTSLIDAPSWALWQELNRRIYRFTYRPESVRELPNSAWSTPPHFANADEQANLNDIIVTALNGRDTFSAGVEFYEVGFEWIVPDPYPCASPPLPLPVPPRSSPVSHLSPLPIHTRRASRRIEATLTRRS